MNRLPSRPLRSPWGPLLRHLAGCAGLRAAWVAAGAAVMLAGCAAPPTRWLALPMLPPAAVASSSSTSPPAASASAAPARMAADAPTLSVRRVVLPEYLQATGVRFRTDAATLDEWPDTLWAERLEVAASRRLSDALRRELPDWTICEGVCPGAALGPAVLVEFSSLDYVRPQRRVEAEVRWRAVAAGPESGLIPALLRATRRPGSSGPSVFAAPSPGPGANVPLPPGASPPPQTPTATAPAAEAAAPAPLPAPPLPAPRRYSVPVAADTAAAQAEAIADVLDRVARDTAAALTGSGPNR
jgi:uncharacterized lipoprotein YmbA